MRIRYFMLSITIIALSLSSLSCGKNNGHTGAGTNLLHYGIDVNLFDSNIGPQNADKIFSLISGTGATFVRVGGSWSGSEPTEGVFDFTYINGVISAAKANGLNVLLSVGGSTPVWDLPSGINNNSDVDYAPADCTGALNGETDCAVFGTYIKALVNDVEPLGVTYLVIRNEPQNFPKNWIVTTGQSITQQADDFAQFLHQAYVNAHSVDPTINILNGGTEVEPQQLINIKTQYANSITLATEQYTFVQVLYSNPLFCNSIDVLDVHIGDHGPAYSPQIVDLSEQALQKCNGGKFVPVWATESGYSSLQAVQTQPEIEAELGTTYINGESSQEKYITDTWGSLKNDPNLIGLNWTFIVDPVYNGSPSQDGAGLGLVDSSYNIKPSYQTMLQTIGLKQ